MRHGNSDYNLNPVVLKQVEDIMVGYVDAMTVHLTFDLGVPLDAVAIHNLSVEVTRLYLSKLDAMCMERASHER